jgi:hypothetical protein
MAYLDQNTAAVAEAKNGGDPISPQMQEQAEQASAFVTALESLDGRGGVQLLARLSDALKLDQGTIDTSIADMVTFGKDLVGGVGQGMTEGDASADAQTMVANIVTAADTAADRHSPAQVMVPLGKDMAAGVGEGMKAYSFTSDGTKTVSNARSKTKTAAATAMPGFHSIGGYIAAGVGEGLASYDFSSDAQSMVAKIKAAIRSAAGIASPATFFMGTGGYVSAGVGVGMRRYDFEPDAHETVAGLRRAMGDQITKNSIDYGSLLSRGTEDVNRTRAMLAQGLSDIGADFPDIAARMSELARSVYPNRAPSASDAGGSQAGGGVTVHMNVQFTNAKMDTDPDILRIGRLLGEETRRALTGVGS